MSRTVPAASWFLPLNRRTQSTEFSTGSTRAASRRRRLRTTSSRAPTRGSWPRASPLGRTCCLPATSRPSIASRSTSGRRPTGRRLGFPPRDVLYPADATLVEWTRTAEGLDRAIQAGMLACWPADNAAPAREVIAATRDGVGAMRRRTGGEARRVRGPYSARHCSSPRSRGPGRADAGDVPESYCRERSPSSSVPGICRRRLRPVSLTPHSALQYAPSLTGA